MQVNRLSLVIAATVGGAAVQLVFQACGSVKGSSMPDAHADSVTADSLTANVPIVTDWVAYTPTLVSVSAGAVVGNAVTKGAWRRVGDTIELRITTALSGMPTGNGCNDFWEWSLPDGVSIDTAKNLGIGGMGNAYQLGSGNAKLSVFPHSATKLVAEGDADCFLNAGVPFTFLNTGSISLEGAFPVAGWTSTQ
jgi:hypothetical protein